MLRYGRIVILSLCLGVAACATREPLNVTNPDASVKIPAMKKAVREHDITALRQLVKDLSSDDPAVRFYAIEALHRLTGNQYGYAYYDDEEQRQDAVARWQHWLAEQESHEASSRPPAEDSRLVGGSGG